MAMTVDRGRRKKVAIIGGGSAGLGALWALNRTHHDVYLYEAADRLGGRTNTVEWKCGKYKTLVDTGFMAMNAATYPNFLRFLDKMHVRTVTTDMTIGVSRDRGIFEWAPTDLSSMFCQRRNLLSPRMWRLIFDIIRFNHFAPDLLMGPGLEPHDARGSTAQYPVSPEETIGQYLAREGYSDAFRDDYLIPLTGAVWSTSPGKWSLDFPVVTLIRVLWNCRLLSARSSSPRWLTLHEGSKAHIDAIMKGFPSNHLLLKTMVRSVTNDDDGRVRLHLEGGKSDVYDHVILATQADEAYGIIKVSASHDEHQIMSKFRTSTTNAILHSDVSFMPRSRKTWSSCNLVSSSNTDQSTLTYNMNVLQHIPRDVFGDVLVTLNPLHEPHPKTIQGRYSYRQPLYNTGTSRAQQSLHRTQNTRAISYAGAWTKDGSHEDGFSSGLYVAQEHLGAKIPFCLQDSTVSQRKKPDLGLADLVLRLLILIVQVFCVEVIDRAVDSYRAKLSLRRCSVKGLSDVVKQKKAC